MAPGYETHWHRCHLASQLQKLPIQSFISSHKSGDDLSNSSKLVGIAWGGNSGNPIQDVEVSFDNGSNWSKAEHIDDPVLFNGTTWNWIRWSLDIPESVKTKRDVQVMCRCRSTAGEEQTDEIGSPKGGSSLYLFNGYHRITLNCTTN